MTHAVRGALRKGDVHRAMSTKEVAVWAPDAAHLGRWPSFVEDATRALRAAGVRHTIAYELPTPSQVNALYTEYLAAHFEEFIRSGELPLREGLPAVLAALVSGGRLDRRVHPNTAVLLAAVAGLSLVHRDKARAEARRAALREAFEARWNEGTLVVSPTTTDLPPRHGRSAFATRIMSFCKAGNLLDATAIAIPFGTFPGTRLPRSLQILGPAGSEEAVMDLAERISVVRQ